jgi:hypothetical protein
MLDLHCPALGIDRAKVETCYCAPFKSVPLKGCYSIGLEVFGAEVQGSELSRGGEGEGEKEEEGKIEGRGTDPQTHLNSDSSTDNYNCLVIYLLDTSTA